VYTDKEITQKLGELDTSAVADLKSLHCILAYEGPNKIDPHFGILSNIIKRQGEVKIEYGLQPPTPLLTAEELSAIAFELDIIKWELNRIYWAVKDVKQPKGLRAKGIILPAWARDVSKAVDISTHSFEVSLSFPG